MRNKTAATKNPAQTSTTSQHDISACQHLVQAVNSDKHYFEVFIGSLQKAINTLADAIHANYRQNSHCETCREAGGICVTLYEIIEEIDCYCGVRNRPKDAENVLSVISAVTALRALSDLPKKLSLNTAFLSAQSRIKAVEADAEQKAITEWEMQRQKATQNMQGKTRQHRLHK